MPKFTTIIRIPQATETEYQAVSQEMQKHLFKPSVKPDFRQPAAEKAFVFNHSGKENLIDLTTTVSAALSAAGKKYAFTIIREKSWHE